MRRQVRIFVTLLVSLLPVLPAWAQQNVISTVIGGGPSDMPAVDANLNSPQAVAVDSAGNYYIAATAQNRIFKVDTSGTLTVLAGNGLPGYSGDGVAGGAANAMINGPQGIAVDASGNVYISDTNNDVIRKVDTTNTITTIAGTAGTCGATNLFCTPLQLAADPVGNLFIASASDCQVKKIVLSTGTVSVFAGNGTCSFSGDGGTPTAAELNYPNGVAVDSSGNVFIADTNNYVVREVHSGKINTVAGTPSTAGFSGDGSKATSATIDTATQLGVSSTGGVVTFVDYYNLRIRQFTVGGNINTVAGDGGAGFCGDGGSATLACLYYPVGVAVSGTGSVYVADTDNERIRQFTVGGNINTVAGNGSTTVPTATNGLPPQDAVLNYPWGVYEDASNNIFVADQADFMVRELVQSSNLLDFFAGNGTYGYSGDGGTATAAELGYTYGIAGDSSGNLYIADTDNCVIRVVNSAGVINLFAGKPNSCGYSGDGGPATSAELAYPAGVYVDSKNNIFIADSSNNVIREVSNGTINTIAGIGVAGYAGDGGPATSAKLNNPASVAEDASGNIYFADTSNCRVREISAATGAINTVAGNGACSFSGDGVATESALSYPEGVTVDPNGNLFIVDTDNELVRWVGSGLMTTIAGDSNGGYSGDGGPATSAELDNPSGIFEDASGNFLVADQYNLRLRGITAFAALNSSAGSLNFPLLSVGATSPAQQVILSAVGPLSISNISITGDFTESDDCPSALSNGSTCTMYVYFAPKAAGIRTGAVTFNTNGYFNNASTIALQGTGTAISLTGAPVAFGNQLEKTTSVTKNVTVKNNGSTAITMGTITLNETTDFAIASNSCPASGQTLAAKSSCVLGLTFTPQSTGTKKGAVIINDNDPTSPQVVGLSGTGTSNVALSPTSVSFAAQAIGTTSGASKITLTNKTGVSLTLGTPALSVTGPFVIAGTSTCTNGLVIAASGTCIINVQFSPTVLGYAAGTLSVSDSDVTSPQTVALSGTGSGVKFTPASINFGKVTVGTQTPANLTITNVGSTTLKISGATISGTNSADFFSSGGNPPCGGSIGAGQTCTLTLYFTPSVVGTEKATYKVYDNSPGSPQSLNMSGTGQ